MGVSSERDFAGKDRTPGDSRRPRAGTGIACWVVLLILLYLLDTRFSAILGPTVTGLTAEALMVLIPVVVIVTGRTGLSNGLRLRRSPGAVSVAWLTSASI